MSIVIERFILPDLYIRFNSVTSVTIKEARIKVLVYENRSYYYYCNDFMPGDPPEDDAFTLAEDVVTYENGLRCVIPHKEVAKEWAIDAWYNLTKSRSYLTLEQLGIIYKWPNSSDPEKRKFERCWYTNHSDRNGQTLKEMLFELLP